MMIKADIYKDYRCGKCNRLLLRGILIDSEIETKCSRCGEMSTLKGDEKSEYMCYIKPCPNRVK